jgi:hypothetical protein
MSPTFAPQPSLSGREGTLVCISISVEAAALEALLEALAQLDFPVNPQIYHDAALVYRYADGHEDAEPTTLVEFPAYVGRLEEVEKGLEAWGFDKECIQVTSMLDEIHADCAPQPAPPGAPYLTRYRRKGWAGRKDPAGRRP